MVVRRDFEPPDLIVATVAGVWTSHEQASLVDWIRGTVRDAGPVALLLVLDDFGGWSPDDDVHAHAQWLRDDEGVSKIAVVGRMEWKVAVFTLVAQPIRSLPIEYFETEAAARAWLGRPAATSQAMPASPRARVVPR
jgi:hypothetical protein